MIEIIIKLGYLFFAVIVGWFTIQLMIKKSHIKEFVPFFLISLGFSVFTAIQLFNLQGEFIRYMNYFYATIFIMMITSIRRNKFNDKY